MQHIILLVMMFSFAAGLVTVVVSELFRRREPLVALSGIRNAVLAFNLLTFMNLIYVYQSLFLYPSRPVGRGGILFSIAQLFGTILVSLYVFFLIVVYLDLSQNTMTRPFKRWYWIAALLLFWALLIGKATDLHISRIQFDNLLDFLIDVGSMGILIGFSVLVFFRANTISNVNHRKTSKTIAAFYGLLFLLFLIFWIALSSAIISRYLSALVISFLFLIFNVAPLFYMNSLLKMHLAIDIRADQEGIFQSLEHQYGITDREMEIIKLIAKGHTNKEIGHLLYIAYQTVKDHNRRIFRKLGVNNRVQLVNMIRNISK